jgi:hypothetical protein
MSDEHATGHGSGADHGADHGDDAGHGDGHGHGDDGLGPVDLRIWGAGLVGVVMGLAGAIVFAIATGRLS